jgi:hypothetical protein
MHAYTHKQAHTHAHTTRTTVEQLSMCKTIKAHSIIHYTESYINFIRFLEKDAPALPEAIVTCGNEIGNMASCVLVTRLFLLFWAIFLCVIAEWNTRDFMRREHTLVKPYQGTFVHSTFLVYLNYCLK